MVRTLAPEPVGTASPHSSPHGGHGLLLELPVSVVGVTTLGSKIAVARLIAPFFGGSTSVWANPIAVVPVGVSIGC